MWDSKDTIAALKHCIKKVKERGVQFVFSASDSFCVNRHKEDFLEVLKESDIFFANADEAKQLAETDDLEKAMSLLAKDSDFLVVTNGKEGANLIVKQKKYSFVSTPDINVIDTTGAGDNFAAGVLSGIIQEKSIEDIGRLGVELAERVIIKYGARI